MRQEYARGMPDSGDWRLVASCRGAATNLWFPERTDYGAYKEAKKICAGCPVKVPCLDEALVNRERWGIFGGLTPREREHMRRRMTRCEWCRRLFSTTPTNRHYCGDECRTAARRRSWAESHRSRDRTG